MNLRPLDWLAWLLSLAVWIGFFLPWVKLPAKPDSGSRFRNGAVVREINSEAGRPWWRVYFYIPPGEWNRALQEAGTGRSGWEIPDLYTDRKNHSEALSLNASGLLGNERQADRSKFVYAFPLLAFLSAAFVMASGRKWAFLLPLTACAGLYAWSRYILDVTYLDRLALTVDIGLGLWLSLYALLGLAVVLLLRLLLPIGTRL